MQQPTGEQLGFEVVRIYRATCACDLRAAAVLAALIQELAAFRDGAVE